MRSAEAESTKREHKPAPFVAAEPARLESEGAPVLLPYQQRLFEALVAHAVLIYEKSRRIGATWGVGAYAVLTSGARKSAGGQDTFYIGYNLELAREFIDCCAMWARAFMPAASEVAEFLFEDDENGDTRQIKAFRITFASGFEIVALSSRPRSLRGRQGFVIFDEAAFHDELEEMLKAALALLIWGGKLLIISTHDGVDNPFNQIINEARAGKRPWPVLRTTFDDAVRDGLYRRVCEIKGTAWTPDGEAAWVAKIRADYGDHAAEELDCVPRASGGKYFARTTLEARAKGGPVLHLALAPDWVDLPEERRVAETDAWIADHLAPLLIGLEAVSSFVGEDFGRTGDNSCQWPLLVGSDLRRRTPFIIELRCVPFTAQQQILFYLYDHLPNFAGAALDARGNGQYLAEVSRMKLGAERVKEVMLSLEWYREHMPRMKAALEDDTMDLPGGDAEVVEDFRQLVVVDGVARPPAKARQTKDRGQRHADTAIGACLALFASNTIEGSGEVVVDAVSRSTLGALGGRGRIAGSLAGFLK